jgi:hypothetical protein
MLVVAASAAVTATFTLVLLAPARLTAVDKVEQVKPLIARPEFTSQGCVFTLKTGQATYEPGEKPTLEVKASNPTDKPVEAKVWINVTARAPSSPMSRMLPIPRAVWTHECAVTLQPGESRTMSIPCDAKLPLNQAISITMSDKKAAMLLENVATQAPPQSQAVQAPRAQAQGAAR